MTGESPTPSRPRRVARFVLAFLALTIVLVGGLWWYIGRTGSTPLERWIGRQIVSAIERHITPRVVYSDLDYQAPLTVVIDDLALLNGDERIIAVHRATLTLAEVPREGRPIQIREIELDRPIIRFVADAQGKMSGWSGIARTRAESDKPASSAPAGDASPTRLSDILVLRQATIHKGRILYDAGEGHPAMILPEIELVLATPPSTGSDGWYECDGHLDRSPQLSLRFDTRLNIDTGELELQSVRLDAAMDDTTYGTMPPAVQRFLAERNIRGRMVLAAKGRIPLNDASAAALDVEADLDRVYFTLGETAWPAQRLDIDLKLAERRLSAECDAQMLGGNARLTASLQFDESRLFKADWRIADVRLEETLRLAQGRAPKYAGRMASQGRITSALANPGATSGEGRVEIADGVLIALPVLAEMHALIGVASRAMAGDASSTGNDRASVDFLVKPDFLDVRDLEVVSTLAAIKGTGRVYYDSRLDLLLNAGPLQRLEKALGPIGSLLSTITDRVAPYQVKGTLGSPQVTIRPLGL